MEITIEYLIIFDQNTSRGFFELCDTVLFFNKYLESNADIKIDKRQICYKSQHSYKYEIQIGSVTGKSQRFFHLILSSSDNEEILADFVELNRSIKTLIHDAGGQPETLWNDVSLFYSQLSYPYIHKIENTMRKLISYFMLTTVGKDWASEVLPVTLKDAVDKSRRKLYTDILHQFDFIHLGDFLFKDYQSRNVNELYEKINSIEDITDITMEDLLSFIPRSNWDRYFSEIVDCDGEYLNKRWKLLYELRCKVAHNSIIGKHEHDSIIQLFDEVNAPLQTAVMNLDKVHIPDEDKEQIAENVVSNISSLYSDFISKWQIFETTINQSNNIIIPKDENVSSSLNTLIEDIYLSDKIDEDTYEISKRLIHFRNKIVHGGTFTVNDQELVKYTEIINDLINIYSSFLKPVSFHNACVERVQAYLGKKFKGEKKTTYRAEDNTIAFSCAISKLHIRNGQSYYWFAFHPRQEQFIEKSPTSYVVFGCGSAENIIIMPLKEFKKHIERLNMTVEENRHYWHIQITKNDELVHLHLKGGEDVDISEYLLK